MWSRGPTDGTGYGVPIPVNAATRMWRGLASSCTRTGIREVAWIFASRRSSSKPASSGWWAARRTGCASRSGSGWWVTPGARNRDGSRERHGKPRRGGAALAGRHGSRRRLYTDRCPLPASDGAWALYRGGDSLANLRFSTDQVARTYLSWTMRAQPRAVPELWSAERRPAPGERIQMRVYRSREDLPSTGRAAH